MTPQYTHKFRLRMIQRMSGPGAISANALAAEVGVSQSTLSRWLRKGEDQRRGPRTAPANKLTDAERARVLETANSPEFRDLSPKQIVPRLADRGEYIASESTFYRVLRDADQMKHREPSRAPSPKPKAIAATGPGQLYSWDITDLRAAVRGTFFYLYLVVDVWSRKIVGAEVHAEESMDNAAAMIARVADKEGIAPGQLVLHSDNGGPMNGATMKATLEALGILPSYSRPRVSDDNPYSEALFRTLKYRPEYPTRPFEDITQAWAWVVAFVDWYNLEHRHSAINYVTPEQRHTGADRELLRQREALYERARAARPSRWSRHTRNWSHQTMVCLNPTSETLSRAAVQPKAA